MNSIKSKHVVRVFVLIGTTLLCTTASIPVEDGHKETIEMVQSASPPTTVQIIEMNKEPEELSPENSRDTDNIPSENTDSIQKENIEDADSIIEEDINEQEDISDIVSTDEESISPENQSDASETEYVMYFSDTDVVNIAKLLLCECGGIPSKTEQACVAWCVLNRVDRNGSSIYEELCVPNQFAFYETTEVREDMYELAYDVLSRWNDEKNGIENSGRVLPQEYIYFHGDGVHNYFRNSFGGDYGVWNYSLSSPYDT